MNIEQQITEELTLALLVAEAAQGTTPGDGMPAEMVGVGLGVLTRHIVQLSARIEALEKKQPKAKRWA